MNIKIPPAALEAGARASHNEWRNACAAENDEPIEYWQKWDDLTYVEKAGWIEQTRAAFLAMLDNWPGMYDDALGRTGYIILPLPQEASDER